MLSARLNRYYGRLRRPLLVPTRSLPDKFDIPRAFARAPSGRVDRVLLAYRDAGTASTRATAAVADVAAAVGARCQVLTSARAAAQAGSSGVLAAAGSLWLEGQPSDGRPGTSQVPSNGLCVISELPVPRCCCVRRASTRPGSNSSATTSTPPRSGAGGSLPRMRASPLRPPGQPAACSHPPAPAELLAGFRQRPPTGTKQKPSTEQARNAFRSYCSCKTGPDLRLVTRN